MGATLELLLLGLRYMAVSGLSIIGHQYVMSKTVDNLQELLCEVCLCHCQRTPSCADLHCLGLCRSGCSCNHTARCRLAVAPELPLTGPLWAVEPLPSASRIYAFYCSWLLFHDRIIISIVTVVRRAPKSVIAVVSLFLARPCQAREHTLAFCTTSLKHC